MKSVICGVAFRFALAFSLAHISFFSPSIAAPWDACGRVDSYPGRSWKGSDPAAHGWDAEALTDAKSRFEIMESASLVVVHKGRLIAEWGASEERFTAQSVRKGLLNSLIGDLVVDKKIALDDTLADLGINDIDPPLNEAERQASLRDLLHSRSGVYHSALYEVGQWKQFRQTLRQEKTENGGHAPGEYWFYNNWDFNVLGTIVENNAGMSIGEFFNRTIARPIGMQDFEPADVAYTTSDHPAERHFGNVSVHRAYLFDISTRDLARYGVLYLGCGEWKGRRVLARDWIVKSVDGIDTRIGRGPDRQNTGFGDWGFLFQVDRPGSRRFESLKTREPVYFTTGNRGHVLAILPYLDLVIAHQVGTRGGISAAAQMKRARFGSPTVSEAEMADLIAAIIAAHPDGATAFVD